MCIVLVIRKYILRRLNVILVREKNRYKIPPSFVSR